MPEISITVSEHTNSLLDELSEDAGHGQSKSSLAAKCIEIGLAQELEARNKAQIYRKMKKAGKEGEKQS